MRHWSTTSLRRSLVVAVHRSLILCALCLSAGGAAATDFTVDCPAGVAAAECELVGDVAARLLSVAEPVPGYAWPPQVFVQASDEVNAFAWSGAYDVYVRLASQIGMQPRENPGADMAFLVITTATLREVIEGDAPRLALIMGHEMGHLLHEHSRKGGERMQAQGTSAFMGLAHGRDDEFEADLTGFELALRAGYSYLGVLKGFKRFEEKGIASYSSLEALRASHPSWKERLARLDENQSRLWQAMSAFENGVLFLLMENYPAAERAFRTVTREFPEASEAWANLGYALLMQYCDALDPDDVRRFDVGHVLVGGFYRRPGTLEGQVRGMDEQLWWDAVEALRKALLLDSSLTLARANLGVAYLLRPAGKDVEQGMRLLEEAAAEAQQDASLDAFTRASVLINTGVANLAGGDAIRSAQAFDQAETYGRAFSGSSSVPRAVEAVLLYNRALMLARTPEGRAEAMDLFERYLQRTSSASGWWALAYDRYSALAAELGRPALTEDQLVRRSAVAFRPFISLELGEGAGITLAEPLADVEQRFGKGERVPLDTRGTSRYARTRYPALGVELIVTDQVIAIALASAAAPALPLAKAGLGSHPTDELRVGMSRDELDELLADADYDFRQLADPATNYRFYRSLGVAVRVNQGTVEEIVIAQVPEARGFL